MTLAETGDETSYGIGIDHTIGNLTFGIGYGTRTLENEAWNGSSHTYVPVVHSTQRWQKTTNKRGIVTPPAVAASVMSTISAAQDQKH